MWDELISPSEGSYSLCECVCGFGRVRVCGCVCVGMCV